MRLLISFAALFLSITFVQLGSGALAPLDALSGAALGFSTGQIGMLGSAHFVGFFIGCWATPRLLADVGHSRAFAAFAASGAIGALAHPLWQDPYAWAAMRVLTGIAVAGAYTTVEGWLQAKVDNQNRGRVMGVYRLVDISASMVAQVLIAVLPPAEYVSYNILAILCCLCLLPMTLTHAQPPETPAAPRLRPLKSMRLSPLGAAGVIVAGATMPAFRMVGPVYGQEVGLRADQIGYFLGASILGGALAQVPVGWLADKYDRRWVLIWLSAAALAVCAATASVGGGAVWAVLLAAFGFGLFSFPIFSTSSAHANDFATPDFVVELNASLMFLYGCGAIASPWFSSILIARYGPSALFVFIAVAHACLIVFGFYRMTRREAPQVGTRTEYTYTPRTSFIIPRLLRRH